MNTRFHLALIAITILGGAGAANAQTAARIIELREGCTVRFAKEVNVPARETGQVAEVNVSLNDAVEAGSPIARLDNQPLLLQRRTGESLLNAARIDADDESEIEFANLSLRNAQLELETSRSIQQDVRGAVPLRQVNLLQLAVDRARVELRQAEKSQQRARVAAEVRRAELSAIDQQLRNLHAESPISGVILDLSRSAGEWIEKGQTIATVGRIDRLHVRALLSSRDIDPAHCKDLPISVHWVDLSSGQERSLRGKVLSVDHQLMPDGRFRAHAEIVNQRDQSAVDRWLLQPGTEVRLKLFVSASTARASINRNR